MVLTTGNRGGKRVAEPAHKGGAQKFCETTSVNENKTRALSENIPHQSADCFELAARATKDAVRDWNVITGTISWPQGLETLFGYSPDHGQDNIRLWPE
jgi:PAS domain-containing protein